MEECGKVRPKSISIAKAANLPLVSKNLNPSPEFVSFSFVIILSEGTLNPEKGYPIKLIIWG